jgi:HEAT repeat protein
VAAVWALGEIGHPGAIPALLRMHGKAAGPNPQLRYEKKVAFPDRGEEMTLVELIEDSIGRLGETVLGKYIAALKSPAGSYRSSSQDTTGRRRSALAVITCVGDRDLRAVDTLCEVLKDTGEAYPDDFRDTAALALARILFERTREFRHVKARDKLSDRLARLLAETLVKIPRGRTREYIASALNLASPTYTVTILTQHFADGSDDKVLRRTIEALGILRSRESVEALRWALENLKDPELRWRAAFGLGLSGQPDMALRAVVEVLDDSAPSVRRAAVQAVARLAPGKAVTLVGPRVKDPDARVRMAALRALARSKDEKAVDLVLPALKDKDVRVRATAVAALAALPGARSLKGVISAVDDDRYQVRFAAMKVLAQVPAPAACAALLRLAGDSNRKIRTGASNALRIAAEHHPKMFRKTLARIIADADHPASARACDYANFPDDPDVVAALRKATRDERPGVRASALRMLERMERK